MVSSDNLLGTGIIFLAESLALRWVLFDYKKFAWARDLILRGFLSELSLCTFCQGCESGLIVYLVNGLPLNFSLVLWPLTAGFFALIFEPLFQKQISNLEQQKKFIFVTLNKVENNPPAEDPEIEYDYFLSRPPRPTSTETTETKD